MLVQICSVIHQSGQLQFHLLNVIGIRTFQIHSFSTEFCELEMKNNNGIIGTGEILKKTQVIKVLYIILVLDFI